MNKSLRLVFIQSLHLHHWSISCFLMFIFSLFCSNYAIAQIASHEIAVTAKEVMLNEQKCFNILITNKEDEAIVLAGQNYRLYYNSKEAIFTESSLISHLNEGYEDMVMKQHFFDVDASGFGTLPFDANLGFLNFGMDYKLHSNKGIELLPNKSVVTSQICFDANDKVDYTWAQENFTSTYATAFVEVSLYDGVQLIKGEIISHEVIENSVLNIQDEEILSFESFPNPFRSQFNVELNYPLISESVLRLENVFGQLIHKENLTKGQSSITIDGNELEAGAYFLSIIQDQDILSTMKIIKID